MNITFYSGPRSKKAQAVLEQLADRTTEELTKKECIECLKENDLEDFASQIQKMKKEEFDDFLVNNVY